MNKLVYLAGPISGCTDEEVMGWRIRATKNLKTRGITAIVPTDVYTEGFALKREFVLKDKADVQRCDVVLMNLLGSSRVSIGTMVELGWADALGKPVVLLMDLDNIHNHGFVKTLATYQVYDLMTGIETVAAILQS